MIDVLIVSDIRLYREGLAEMLTRDGQLRMVGTAESIGVALGHLDPCHLCVVLLDMGMPEILEAVRALTALGDMVKVVALGISETRENVVSCAEAGIRGYICRESSLSDLVAAVQRAVDGKLHCPPRIAAALMDSVARLAARATANDGIQLTAREIEVAELLDQGSDNREIALRLHISIATVKVHVHHILEKLGTRRRGEAAAKLRHLGLFHRQRLRALPRSTPAE